MAKFLKSPQPRLRRAVLRKLAQVHDPGLWYVTVWYGPSYVTRRPFVRYLPLLRSPRSAAEARATAPPNASESRKEKPGRSQGRAKQVMDRP
ncbi:hypothetical protein MTO96_009945 [Rhipicephalus appendiculatus]